MGGMLSVPDLGREKGLASVWMGQGACFQARKGLPGGDRLDRNA